MGSLTQAMASAAKAAGVEIRTGAEVIEIRVKDGAATGVLLATGEEISAKAVSLECRSKTNSAQADDPTHLSPDFVHETSALSRQRHGRQGQPGALRPANFYRSEKRGWRRV
jgi:phytoene dehydrogenase-like protein